MTSLWQYNNDNNNNNNNYYILYFYFYNYYIQFQINSKRRRAEALKPAASGRYLMFKSLPYYLRLLYRSAFILL